MQQMQTTDEQTRHAGLSQFILNIILCNLRHFHIVRCPLGTSPSIRLFGGWRRGLPPSPFDILGGPDTQVSLVRFKDTPYFYRRPSGASESAALHGVKNTSTEFAVISVTCQNRENPAGIQVSRQAWKPPSPPDEKQIALATKPQNLTPLQIILDSNDISFANNETLLQGLGFRISVSNMKISRP